MLTIDITPITNIVIEIIMQGIFSTSSLIKQDANTSNNVTKEKIITDDFVAHLYFMPTNERIIAIVHIKLITIIYQAHILANVKFSCRTPDEHHTTD